MKKPRKQKTRKRKAKGPPPEAVALWNSSPYLRGDAEAGYYLKFKDKQGRGFRAWAMEVYLPYNEIRGVRTYYKPHVDRAWAKHAHNMMGFN